MATEPPQGMDRINPYLYYEDVTAALAWLKSAFGLEERIRIREPDGAVTHAEMTYEGGVVMLGCPGKEFSNPARTGSRHGALYIYVPDVDAHFEHARARGAKVIHEPETMFYGDRRYAVEDLEGHHWFFATHVRDVPIEELPGAG